MTAAERARAYRERKGARKRGYFTPAHGGSEEKRLLICLERLLRPQDEPSFNRRLIALATPWRRSAPDGIEPGGSDSFTIHTGDCRDILPKLTACSVQCCITSPPYYGLRNYRTTSQIGLEPTPDEYIANLVGVFREVRKALKDDGTIWLNLGDTYARNGGTDRKPSPTARVGNTRNTLLHIDQRNSKVPTGLKEKDLLGIPWRVALALQADGWWLRQDIVWSKPNSPPESVRDRFTRAHEYIFLFSKCDRYFFDLRAVQERAKEGGRRNKRSVWSVPIKGDSKGHAAKYPRQLIRPCVLAGSAVGDLVLDPFAGSGTTGEVALATGRRAILIEANPNYVRDIEERMKATMEAHPRKLREGWNFSLRRIYDEARNRLEVQNRRTKEANEGVPAAVAWMTRFQRMVDDGTPWEQAVGTLERRRPGGAA